MSQPAFEVLAFVVIVALLISPAVFFVWKLVALSWSTRRFIAKAQPLRQLNDAERAALAFMDSRAIGFIHLVGTTILPFRELETAQGKAAAVYRLCGPLKISGYGSQWGGEVHYAIQNVEVFMAVDRLTDFTREQNIVDVVFCKNVGIVLSCNDAYSLVDASAAWKQRIFGPEAQ
ncbi:hypothetical protein ACIOWE_19410 [Pseudomonas sp. NPDC087598]|uniref:hypothetical protein n=1 Tax=Pseudomonas sp. NPDC087598 TaxID=3364440 RepID=UPI003815931B